MYYTCSYIILFFGVWLEERFGDKFACSRENYGVWFEEMTLLAEGRIWIGETFA